jgi:hypothetical protein
MSGSSASAFSQNTRINGSLRRKVLMMLNKLARAVLYLQ